MEDAQLVDAEGKPLYVFHALRHVFASLQIDQGVQPKYLQELMGHSKIAVTLGIYGHLWRSEDEHEVARRIEENLLGRAT